MIFTSSVQIRTVARNNIGAAVPSTAIDWNKVFVSVVISPKYKSKPNLSIISAIEVIAVARNLPPILTDRLQAYSGDLECKISDKWAKVSLIDSVTSPINNNQFVKVIIENLPPA